MEKPRWESELVAIIILTLFMILPDRISIKTEAAGPKLTAIQIMSSAKRSVVFIEAKK